jgi:hypothetical protein
VRQNGCEGQNLHDAQNGREGRNRHEGQNGREGPDTAAVRGGLTQQYALCRGRTVLR